MRLFILFAAAFVVMALPAPAAASDDTSATTPAEAVVVSQNDVSLTLADIDAYAMSIPEDKRAAVFNDPQRIASILHNLLVTKQLAREAQELGLAEKPDVKAALERAKEHTLSDARMKALRTKFQDEIPDMSELARERYASNPDEYVVPARIDVKHILISTKNRSEEDAKKKAASLYTQLLNDPAQFDADVDKYSDDPSKDRNHGLIEDATSDKLVGPFRDAASKLTTVGELAGPVKTRFGYHIIKAAKITPAEQRSFAQVKDQIVKKLQQDWVSRQVQGHVDRLGSGKLDANPDLVASLRSRYMTGGNATKKPASAKTKYSSGSSRAQ